jgi:hypothetical protein
VHAASVLHPGMLGHIAAAWLAQVAPAERAQHAPTPAEPDHPADNTAIVDGTRGSGSCFARRAAVAAAGAPPVSAAAPRRIDGAAAVTAIAAAAATANHTIVQAAGGALEGRKGTRSDRLGYPPPRPTCSLGAVRLGAFRRH